MSSTPTSPIDFILIADDVTLQLGDVKNRLTEIENKTSDITLEFNKIKELASD
jgi:hypothetical protein